MKKKALDKKLLFYNDIKVRNLIIENPKHLMQGLTLSYARHQFFVTKGLGEKDLFLSDTRFTSIYGVKNKTLVIKYPILEPTYLVKK